MYIMTCDSCGSDDITTFTNIRVIKQTKFLFGLYKKEKTLPIKLLYHCNSCGCLKFLIEVFGNYTRVYPDTSTYQGTHVTPSSAWESKYPCRCGGDGYARYISKVESYFISKLSNSFNYKPNGPVIYICSKYRSMNCLNCDLGNEEREFHTGYYCPIYYEDCNDKISTYIIRLNENEIILKMKW